MKKLISAVLLYAVTMTVMGFSPEGLKVVKGIILDAKSNKPLARCNVYVKGEDLGTVSNNAGEFVLKIPEKYQEGTLVVSSMGFEKFEIPINQVPDEFFEITLRQAAVILDEVVIADVDAIIVAALNNRPNNYPDDYNVMTSFYREVIKKNRSYVEVAQGIFNISKSPYSKKQKDQLGIVMGGKTENYKKGDTLAFKVMGGPNVMLLLDIVKNPGVVLDYDMLEYYDYTLHGVEVVDGRRSYVVHFKPNSKYDSPLYSGVIYIDEKTLAIVAINFGYDERNLKWASTMMIKKQPSWVRVIPQKSTYEVKYRETNGLWYLDYLRNEMEVKCNWKKRLFNSTFHSVSEMVVTEKNVKQDAVIDKRNLTKLTDIFSEKVIGFSDEAYWQNYSIIQPEEDLRKALAKIERKTQGE